MGSCYITQGTQPGALWQFRGVDGVGDGKKVQEGENICMTMADTSWCVGETNIVKQSSSNENKYIFKNLK